MLNNIVFIHIPKNAGTSIISALADVNGVEAKQTHNTDFNSIKKEKKRQLLVIRNPINRFCSSVNYTVKFEVQHSSRYRNTLKNYISAINFLKENNFVRPSEWIKAIQNTKHKYYEAVKYIIFFRRHFDLVNGFPLPCTFHFSPQYYWFRNPDYVLIFDNLNKEFNIFCEQILGQSIKLPKLNISYSDCELSNSDISFIKNLYFRDMSIYTKTKNISLEKRISKNRMINYEFMSF